VDNIFRTSSGYSLDLIAMISPSWLTRSSLWLHVATLALFVLGLITTVRRKTPLPHGVRRIIPFGRVFFAVPLALFGMQHFLFANDLKDIVPAWIPWHIFWTYLVGVALISTCMSILMEIKANLAALLAGIMFFLFVLMIYVPNLILNLHDRFAITVLLRDLVLSGGALALAGDQATVGRQPVRWLVNLGCWFFAAPMLYFGAEHYLHPEFAPGVPFPILMPSWMPWRLAWAYAMGTVLLVCGASILAKRRAGLAAAWLGIAFLMLVIVIYMPLEILHPSIALGGELDFVTDTMAMSGAALLVAGAMARETGQAGAPAQQLR
jgi:uncharacterized membrane protein